MYFVFAFVFLRRKSLMHRSCLPPSPLQFPETCEESSSPFVFICTNPQELLVKFPMKGKHKICEFTFFHVRENGVFENELESFYFIYIYILILMCISMHPCILKHSFQCIITHSAVSYHYIVINKTKLHILIHTHTHTSFLSELHL